MACVCSFKSWLSFSLPLPHPPTLSGSSLSPSGTQWKNTDWKLKHVTVSPRGFVWGVNASDEVFYRQGISDCNVGGSFWKPINGSLKQISNGRSGVWGVNANDEIFYREGTFGDNGSEGTSWIQVSDFIGRLLSSVAKRAAEI